MQAATSPADTCRFHPGFNAIPLFSAPLPGCWYRVQLARYPTAEQEAAYPCNAAEGGLIIGTGRSSTTMTYANPGLYAVAELSVFQKKKRSPRAIDMPSDAERRHGCGSDDDAGACVEGAR